MILWFLDFLDYLKKIFWKNYNEIIENFDIQNYNINNIDNHDNNIVDDKGAAPIGFNINMDSKKNY